MGLGFKSKKGEDRKMENEALYLCLWSLFLKAAEGFP